MSRDEFFEIIGMTPIEADNYVPDSRDHLILCQFPNGTTQPRYISGPQWDMMYWIWRLSEEPISKFSHVLGNIIATSL